MSVGVIYYYFYCDDHKRKRSEYGGEPEGVDGGERFFFSLKVGC
ncbi:hypothetical protein MSP8886_03455 [Marinomonas spartinae]|uniref:Uncharacterized protein n=1 Tax=Marinomonas spartinae TaxID=1792290 RepID=A0A1A8TP89_9GAMM|nr:hypothetical protein MSP8886_03455 [Marinomonas spartinae]